MAASHVSVPTELQLTYINRWIRSFARSVRTLPSRIFHIRCPKRAGVLLSPPSINCPARDW